MEIDILLLSLTAASVGFIHTVTGPDHYIPFIVMAKAGKWSKQKTFWITLLCGMGHVGSSIILGILGLALGLAVQQLNGVENFRGNLAGWALIAFGLVYFAWGLNRAYRNKPHTHIHAHGEGVHVHEHTHQEEHLHLHTAEGKKVSMTPWILFTVFIFGPCEPLIPLFMYPAARHSWWGIVSVTGIFSLVTISTMMSIVFLAIQGLNILPFGKLERYTHALAGFTVFLCGIAIQFLGL
jgi:sulfite exporter TauE/SafE